jgi:tRNA A37 methylthiotransferase MiaB
LNEYEFAIVYAIYFEQRSVAEVARQKHKTRQAINQTKIKALQKIKEAWGKDKNTAI